MVAVEFLKLGAEGTSMNDSSLQFVFCDCLDFQKEIKAFF